MKLYRTTSGLLAHHEGSYYRHRQLDLDTLLCHAELYEILEKALPDWEKVDNGEAILENDLLPPIGTQEVWASGVTYYRSRDARMEESKEAGGGSFYDRVYEAVLAQRRGVSR